MNNMMNIAQKLQKIPALCWLPIGYLLLAVMHALALSVLPLPPHLPKELATHLQQQPVTLSDIAQSVERLAQKKALAEL